jgi:hypothetical protein
MGVGTGVPVAVHGVVYIYCVDKSKYRFILSGGRVANFFFFDWPLGMFCSRV